MAAKRLTIEEMIAKSESLEVEKTSETKISIDRLAVDLFRYITCAFRVKPEPIPKTSLEENIYSSISYIKDISRPIIFYSVGLRDLAKEYLEKFPAENMADTRDNLENICNTLFSVLKEKANPDIYKQIIISTVICTELIQYLNFKGSRDYLKDVPDIWVNIFKNRLSNELEIAGGFKEYISYWDFLKATDAFTFKYIKRCSPYDQKPVSEQFKATVVKLEVFNNREHLRRIFRTDSNSPKGTFSMLEKETPEPVESPPQDVPLPEEKVPTKDPKESAASQSVSTAKKRQKKLKLRPKPGQSFASFQAERKAQLEEEKSTKDVDECANQMEKLDGSTD